MKEAIMAFVKKGFGLIDPQSKTLVGWDHLHPYFLVKVKPTHAEIFSTKEEAEKFKDSCTIPHEEHPLRPSSLEVVKVAITVEVTKL